MFNPFKTAFAENIFRHRYAQGLHDSWANLAERVVEDVCGKRWGRASHPLLSREDQLMLKKYIGEMKFIPAGRYLYYAGRPVSFWNNCFPLKAEEDTREEWGRIYQRASDCLMSGGGIGIEYSKIRSRGKVLSKTGGVSSGPLPLMNAVNEIGRSTMQGGSRRSAIMGILNWQHGDNQEFIHAKNWSPEIRRLKEQDFNFPAPFDTTNMSVGWDDDFLEMVLDGEVPDIWYQAVKEMLQTGEPGQLFNFDLNAERVTRNACGEIDSEDDSDVCNLGSVNFSRIEGLAELQHVCELGAKFLVCGTMRGQLPYDKVYTIRDQNRRIGLGLMGVHEWLLQRGYQYEVTPELRDWLTVYEDFSEIGAKEQCDRFFLNYPEGYRAIAPNGTTGILASTTGGIEPLFAVAYKRRYLVDGDTWKYTYVIDATAEQIINETGADPDSIETAQSLAADPRRRVEFQAEVQGYVDHCISSTINLPAWGTELNNQDKVKDFADMLLDYVPQLRGITVYPDGARGGQPITAVPYEEAKKNAGCVFDEIEEKCSGGVCGL